MRRLSCIAALSVLVGCGAGGGKVTRVIDGRVVVGRFVAPEAYALFLRGAIAEGSGALPEAIAAYEAVARVDDKDPEVFARIARARCARDPGDAKARDALERAFALDADYGPAFAAAAACGDTGAAARAARAEPRDAGAQIAYARTESPAAAARSRLLELTLEQPNDGDAWDALSSWADAHDDLDLLVLALGETSKRVPRLDAVTAKRVLVLAGEGQTARARRVAAALLDARALAERGGAPLDEATRAAVGRLAVDEAADRGDEAALRRRAIAARLPIAEAAARAALATRFDLAASIARATLAADPNDAGARMVLAASAEARSDTAAMRAAFTSSPRTSAPAGACALLARALLRASSADAAKNAMSAATCDPVARDDAPVVSLWVDLAARGIVPEASLPPEGRIELAFRKREPLGDTPRDLDVRHELLARAHRDPKDARAAELATKLARRSPSDPIILASLLAVARAHNQTLDDLARAALAPPADPVLDAALLEALPSTAPERTRIRTRFAALAATPAERALIR